MDLAKPFVSIIIPAYNRDQFIQETVESALAQTWPEKEVIVIDDGSTDNTGKILESFEDRIVLIKQENHGVGFSRNIGIKASKGDFLVFLDSDDILEPNFLEVMVTSLLEHPEIDVIYCWWSFINEKGELLPEVGSYNRRGNLYLDMVISNRLPIMAVLLRRYCVEAVGGFDVDPLVSEDWYFFIKLAEKGYNFDYVPISLVKYRFHGTNVTLNVSRSHTRYINALDKFFESKELPLAVLQIKALAYSQVYLTSALYAWAQSDLDSARRYLSEGIQQWPELLIAEETYYRICCAHQPPGYRDTEYFKDIPAMEKQIDEWLQDLFGDPDLPANVSDLEKKAQTAKTFALAWQYFHAGEDAQAMRLLNTLLAKSPYLIFTRRFLGLWLRTLIGRKQIHRMKKLVPWTRAA